MSKAFQTQRRPRLWVSSRFPTSGFAAGVPLWGGEAMTSNSSRTDRSRDLRQKIKDLLKQVVHIIAGYLIFYVIYLSGFWFEQNNFSGFLGIAALTIIAGGSGAFASGAYLNEFGALAAPKVVVPFLLIVDLGTGTYLAHAMNNGARFEAGVILTIICLIWIFLQIRLLIPRRA